MTTPAEPEPERTPAPDHGALPPSPPGLAAALLVERLRLYRASFVLAIVAQVLVGALLATVAGPAVAWPLLLAWLAVLVFTLGLRAVLSLPLRRGADPTPELLWRQRAAVLVSGFAWGLAGWLMLPAADLQTQMLVVFVLAGVAAGSLMLSAFDFGAPMGFALLTMAPVALRLATAGDRGSAVMAAMAALFVGYLALVGWRAQRNLREAVAARCAEAARAEALQRQQRAQQQLADELARQREALRVTLDSMDQGILSLDAEGRTNFFNRRLLELTGWPEALMAGRPTMDEIARHQLASGEFGPAMANVDEAGRDALRDWYAGKPGRFPPTYYRRTPAGLMLQVKSHYLPDGALVRTFTDVSAFFDTQQRLHAARDEAERASRAKSDFLSAMSHELRTPLNAILGFAQLLQIEREPALSARQREHVQHILGAGAHLLDLINDVLDLARVESGRQSLRIEAVDLAPLVGECLALMQPLAQARAITLDAGAHDAGLPAVQADRTRLRQVLLNLLGNAIKYNRAGGRVRMQAEIADGTLRLGVADDGPGLDADQRARLFTPFDRLDAEQGLVEGAGIGLALSRRLVELMGGTIEVDSEPGRGSVFWLRLVPAVAGDRAAGAAAAAPSAAVPASEAETDQAEAPPSADRGGRHVLYIEDNPINVRLVQAVLEQEPGIRLSTAVHPEDGLRMAQSECPDLVLLDIHLPGMDGYELLARLRADERTRRVPVVGLSADAMHGQVERARAAGFDRYLTKPIDVGELLAVVRAGP